MTDFPPRYLQGKVYPARLDRQLMAATVRQGVIRLSEFAGVASGSARAITVSSGNIFVQGSESANQGMYHCFADAPVDVTIAPAASFPRIDSIYVVVHDPLESGTSSIFERVVQQGTETSGTTLDSRAGANVTVPNNSFWICDVLATVGSGLIPAANVRDKRKVRKGWSVVGGSEARTNTSYGLMPTPDIVRNLDVPTGCLIEIAFQARWQETGLGAARAAIFLSNAQLFARSAATGAQTVNGQEARINAVANTDYALFSNPIGLASLTTNVAAPADTGGQSFGGMAVDSSGSAMKMGFNGSSPSFPGPAVLGGKCVLFVAAGTYDIGVQFKASGTDTVTANGRILYVEVIDYVDFR